MPTSSRMKVLSVYGSQPPIGYETLGIDAALAIHAGTWSRKVAGRHGNISHLLEWVRAAADSHGLTDSVQILIWTDSEGELMGLVPVRIQRRTMTGVPLKTLEVGAGLVAYHPDWLGLCDADSMFEDLIAHASSNRCDAIHFPGIADGSSSSQCLRDRITSAYACIQRASETSPVIRIDTNWDGYLSACSKKWRYTLRKMLASIEQNPDIEVRWYRSRGNLEEFFDTLLRIEARSWKARVGKAITPDGREHRYYMRLLPWLAEVGALAANVIIIGGVPASYNLCYRWNGEMGSMKTSFDASRPDMSPGTLAYCSSVRHAFEAGMKIYDFLGDKAQHKTKWTNSLVHHTDYLFLLPTPPSRLARSLRSMRLHLRSRVPFK